MHKNGMHKNGMHKNNIILDNPNNFKKCKPSE